MALTKNMMFGVLAGVAVATAPPARAQDTVRAGTGSGTAVGTLTVPAGGNRGSNTTTTEVPRIDVTTGAQGDAKKVIKAGSLSSKVSDTLKLDPAGAGVAKLDAPNNPFGFARKLPAIPPEKAQAMRGQILAFIQQKTSKRPEAIPKTTYQALETTLTSPDLGQPIEPNRRTVVASTEFGVLVDVSYGKATTAAGREQIQRAFLFGPADQKRMTNPASPFARWNGPTGRTGLFQRGNELFASWYFLAPQERTVVVALGKENQHVSKKDEQAVVDKPAAAKRAAGIVGGGK